MKKLIFNRLLRVFSLTIACVMVMSVMSVTAFAAEGATATLSVLYKEEEKPIADVEFKVYQLATFESGYNFNWNPSFEQYHVTVPSDWNSTQLNNMASTLAAYASRDNIAATYTVKTGIDGKFSIAALPQGMYLIVGSSHSVKNGGTTTTYTPVPALVFFPYFDPVTQKNSMEASIEVKHTTSSVTDTISRHVLKSWDDAGYTSNRPDSISVDLLRDGTIVDTVILSPSNNWRYTWKDLEGGHNYQVVESNVFGRYTTSTRLEGGTWVITNTYDAPPVRPNPLPDPETPLTTIPTQPPILSEYPFEPTVEIDDPAPPLSEKIPQTGQLLWPIPYLAVAGVASLVLGFYGKRKKEDDVHEEAAE